MPFKKGEVTNPLGYGHDGQKLARDLRKRYTADFKKHGMGTIEKVRENNPVEYLRLGVALMPKQAQVTIEHDFSDVLMRVAGELERQNRLAHESKGELVIDAEIVPEPAKIGRNGSK